MSDNNFLKENLLPGSFDPKLETRRKAAIKKRTYRRARSDPLIEHTPPEVNEVACSRTPVFSPSNVPQNLTKLTAFVLVYLAVGVVGFYTVRNQISGKKTNDIVDALYFCVVTMTTLGYGDLVPQSVLSKLLACAFVFLGMALIGLILSKGADYLVVKQEALLVKAWHMREKFGPSDIMKEIETHNNRYKCVLVLLLLLVLVLTGTVFLTVVEKLEFVDAFYCVCCTITTLGYGDHSFSTKGGRVFAIVWILVSTICLAQFFLYVAELNTEQRQREVVEGVLNRHMTNLDLKAADIDDDRVVDYPEFALYKLKEMGKITQEDLNLIMEEFEELDVDQSGTLSISDITLAQSTPIVKFTPANEDKV